MNDSDELLSQEINHIAQVLEIAAPVEATAEERRQWVAWWTPSYESALKMTDEHKATLKNGRWWPPLCGSMIDGAAPEIVLRTPAPASIAPDKREGFTPTPLCPTIPRPEDRMEDFKSCGVVMCAHCPPNVGDRHPKTGKEKQPRNGATWTRTS